MRNFAIASCIYSSTSFILFVYNFLHISPEIVFRIIILLGFLIVLSINGFWISSIKKRIGNWGRWTFLFIINLLIQLLILYTGALESPFFIFFHLAFLGISFIFSISNSILFLIFSLINLTTYTLLNPESLQLVLEQPTTLIVYGISFVAFLPIAQILAHQYHIKDRVFDLLKYQVKVEESILKDVNELVFVTDIETHILSANETAQRVLNKSFSEMQRKKLFDVLFLKDENGKLIDSSHLELTTLVKNHKPTDICDLLLISTSAPRKKVCMTIKPISIIEEFEQSITFIIRDQTVHQTQNNTIPEYDESSLKLEALSENLKTQLYNKGLTELAGQFLLINKHQRDIEKLKSLTAHGLVEKKSVVDIAQLCRDTVNAEQEFAALFHVTLTFTLTNFSDQNLPPFMTKIFKFSPDMATGPFFSANCDVTHTGLLVQKLVEMAVLLSASDSQKNVIVAVEQDFEETVSIKISARASSFSEQDKDALFSKNYENISVQTMQLGSGLEGHIAKMISHYLQIPVQVNYDDSSKYITLELLVHKNTPTYRLLTNEKKLS